MRCHSRHTLSSLSMNERTGIPWSEVKSAFTDVAANEAGYLDTGKCFIQRCPYLNISCSSAAVLMFYLTPNHLIKEIKMLPIFSFHSSLIVLSLHSAPPPVCSSSLLAGHLFSFTSLSPIPPSNPHTHTHTHTGHGSNYLQTLFWRTTFLLPFLIAYKCYPNQIRLIKNICKATGMLGQ